MLGIYYEEYEVGKEIISVGRTITEADVVTFGTLTGDLNPLHMDAEFSAKDSFGQRIAHGKLGESIMVGLMSDIIQGSVVAFLGSKTEFKLPIFLGDTVHLEYKCIDKRLTKKGDKGIVNLDLNLINQRGELVTHSQFDFMVYVKEKDTRK
uniref:MaoC/PaaZ C-terminal domain-containing protein n=1 Tax=Anaerococcus mediterraneensis TaxID=1870984 RepID=UPI0009310B75|nr:MaoC/PaaZ C-terminal domain-containing protein [Anaerococcus mediterraneensis]